jgi:hypothetical protein
MPSTPREYVQAVRELFKGGIVHHGSVLVDCTHLGKDGWRGYVEVFSLEGHTSGRAFAWKWDDTHCVAALSSPTIQSPFDAVRAALQPPSA